MGTRHALTTVDNPFDPIDDFNQWLVWDREAGYDTPNYLGRIVTYSDELPSSLQDQEVSDSIDDILKEHGFEMYRKVSRDYPEPTYSEAV